MSRRPSPPIHAAVTFPPAGCRSAHRSPRETANFTRRPRGLFIPRNVGRGESRGESFAASSEDATVNRTSVKHCARSTAGSVGIIEARMVLTKEYRICMPLTTEEYRIGQLYMIARHSHEQSDNDEGVEVVENSVCEDPVHGMGQYTEKRIHLSSKLPYWIQSILPRIFYVTEKAWNYYPFTITDYTCSFIPKFHIAINTRYEDNNGSTENCLGLSPIELIHREVDFVDIAYDELSAKHYKEEEDPKYFQSKKTGRGPLVEGWRDTTQPIMCSYKLVHASFEVWGMQTRVEDFIHRCIRDVLLLGHRQAFAWIDEWHDMTLEDVRQYEQKMQAETNEKVRLKNQLDEKQTGTPSSSMPTTPKSPTQRSWFSWS